MKNKIKDLQYSIDSVNTEIDYKNGCIEKNIANDNKRIVAVLRAERAGLISYKLGLTTAMNILEDK